jgi:hypothetical protein
MKKSEIVRVSRFLWSLLDDDDKETLVRYDEQTAQILSGDTHRRGLQNCFATCYECSGVISGWSLYFTC